MGDEEGDDIEVTPGMASEGLSAIQLFYLGEAGYDLTRDCFRAVYRAMERARRAERESAEAEIYGARPYPKFIRCVGGRSDGVRIEAERWPGEFVTIRDPWDDSRPRKVWNKRFGWLATSQTSVYRRATIDGEIVLMLHKSSDVENSEMDKANG